MFSAPNILYTCPMKVDDVTLYRVSSSSWYTRSGVVRLGAPVTSSAIFFFMSATTLAAAAEWPVALPRSSIWAYVWSRFLAASSTRVGMLILARLSATPDVLSAITTRSGFLAAMASTLGLRPERLVLG